jgi:glycosyltransferase involved in cell wall biosynthesis
MERPLFSIITVTYNPGKGLARTVESIKTQRCQEFEHIIKDGGSTDGSVQQFARALNGYNPIVICTPDQGIYDGMNQALNYCTGKYVYFLNAGDEFIDENVLTRILSAYQRRPEIDLVYTDYISTNSLIKYGSPRKLYGYTMFRNMLCHQVMFLSAARLNGQRFDTRYKVAADYDLFLRLINDGLNYEYLPFVSVVMQAGGYSSRNQVLSLKEVKIIRKIHFGAMALMYSIAHAITFPALRKTLSTTRGFALIYRIIANFFNRYI